QELLHEFHRIVHVLANRPQLLERFLIEQHLLAAGSRTANVERREDSSLRELAVEMKLHVARALELLIDDIVHPRARIDKRRRQNRKAAALLDVARRPEEPLRAMERR